MARPDPASLRQAADAVEKAVAATQAAQQKEEAARLARADANTAEANADDAVRGACGTGCNGQPPQPPQPPVTPPIPPSGNGKGKKKGCCCCGIIGIILGALALIFCSVLAFTKASTGSLDEVKESVASAMTAMGLVGKKADEAKATANEARAEAKACAQTCNKKPETKQPTTAKKPQAVKKPQVPKPAPQAAVTPQEPRPAPGLVLLITPGPAVDRHSVSYEDCRLRSDGTARLLTDKKTVLTHGHVIAVESQDSSSPFVRISGEDCDAWRARMTTKLVDKTTGGG